MDELAIIVTCPENQIQNNDPEVCNAFVNVLPPAVDDPTQLNSITNSYNGTSDASDVYPVGTTLILWTLEDLDGIIHTCSQEIEIIDNETPSIVCPDNIDSNTDFSLCGANLIIPIPEVSDNCPSQAIINNYNFSNDASGYFPIGTTEIIWTVTDQTGNSDQCSQFISIADSQSPQIICPDDIDVFTDNSVCGANLIIDQPTVNDNCSIQLFSNDYNNSDDASGFYLVGTATITWTAFDEANNSSQCIQTVTVMDEVAPLLACPEDIIDTAENNECGKNLILDQPGVSENCSVISLSNDYNGTSNSSDYYPVGTTEIIWIAEDPSNNLSQCSQFITIEDLENPEITCPDDITILVENGLCDIDLLIAEPVVTDNCSIDSYQNDYNSSSNASDSYPVGSTTIQWTVNDINNNSAQCSQIIIVNDSELPEIICPDDIQALSELDLCGSNLLVPSPTGSDNCNFSITNDWNNSDNASGFYPIGTTLLVWTITDESGNMDECTQEIQVDDSVSPQIFCPDDLNSLTEENLCSSYLEIDMPVIIDNCALESVSNDYNGTNNASGDYPLGQTTIIWTVEDTSGNTANCTQTISIEDLENPEITCPEDILIANDPNSCDRYLVMEGPEFTDNCDDFTLSNDYNDSEDASDIFPLGTTIVTWTVSDLSENINFCTQNITIFDNEAPLINCLEDQYEDATGDCEAYLSDYRPLIEASDNCDDDLTVIQTPEEGTLISSSTLVTLTVIDQSNNSVDCVFTVFIDDNIAPEITCPEATSFDAELNNCGAIITPELPFVNDNCGVESLINNITNSENATGFYAVGIHEIIWTVEDINGNENTCSTNLEIIDSEIPSIECSGNILLEAEENSCNALVQINTPNTDDNCEIASITNDYNGLDFIDELFDLGVTTITWTVVDIHDNINTCSQNVAIIDTQNPELNCIEDQDVSVNENCQFQLEDYRDLFMVSDNCDANITLNQDPSPGVFLSGSNQINVTATDDFGNHSTCSFYVNPIDILNPELTCGENILIGTEPGLCGANISLDSPIPSDNCGISSFSNDYNNSEDASGFYPTGLTIVTWTVTDLSGNSASCQQEIEVLDIEIPEITCQGDIIVENDWNECGALISIAQPFYTDNCEIQSITNNFNSSSNASDIYPIGVTTIEWEVFDINGNVNYCYQNIIVNDSQAPSISCIEDQIIEGNENCEALIPDFTDSAIISDNCSNSISVSQIPSPNELLNGSAEISLIAMDSYGNSDTCQFHLSIIDLTEPIIENCPDDQIILLENDCAYTIPDYSWTINTYDNCDSNLEFSQFPLPGTVISGHNTTEIITYSVIDDSENSTECSFTLTLLDETIPDINCPENIVSNSDSNECGAYLIPENPIATDNCQIQTILNNYTGTNDATELYPVGITELVWTATDIAGNTNSCIQEIEVIDNLNPLIFCTGDLQVEAINGECEAYIDIVSALTFDYCEVGVPINDYNNTQDASDIYPIGNTQVIWTVSDENGNTGSCIQNISVIDLNPPSIECGESYSEILLTGCEEYVTLDSPMAMDDCGIQSIVNNYNGTDNASDFYSGGYTEIIWSATDLYGNTSNCIQTVELIDNILPEITCIENLTFPYIEDDIYPDPLDYILDMNDNCHIDFDAIQATPNYFDMESIGENIVTIEIQDVNGNSNTCEVNVTIIDDDYPVALCVPFLNIYLDDLGTSTIEGIDLDNGSFDSNAIDSYTASVNEFNCENIDQVNVTQLTVTDNIGLTSTCQVLVTVFDEIDPNMNCQDISISLDENGEYTLDPQLINDNSMDNCSDIELSVDMNLLTCDNLGETIVTLMGSDEYSNESSCEAVVTVLDLTAPEIINCENINNFFAADSTCGDFISLSEIELPQATDNCQINSIHSDFIDNMYSEEINFLDYIDSTIFFPLTNESITWTIEDSEGNSSNCLSTFTMMDTTRPKMDIETEILIILPQDECLTNFEFIVEEEDVSDNCGLLGYTTEQTDEGIGVGSNLNNYTALDVNGNSLEDFIDQYLYVIDTIAPIIDCQDTVLFYTEIESCLAQIALEPSISEWEACPENLASIDNFNDEFGIGSFEYTWEIIDSKIQELIDDPNAPFEMNEMGQAVYNDTLVFDYRSTCVQTFTIVDTIAPAILDIEETISIFTELSGEWVEIPIPEVNDNCQVESITTNYTGNDNLYGQENTENYFDIGYYEIEWTINDIYGNTSLDTTVVLVSDDGSPLFINCIEEQFIYVDENCEFEIPDFQDFFEIIDFSSGDIVITQSPDFSESFNEPAQVTVTATDEDGNWSNCQFTLSPIDTISPQISCPEMVYLCPNIHLEDINITYDDNCDIISEDSLFINGNLFFNWINIEDYVLQDTTIVDFFVSDQSSNSNSCTVTLIPFLDHFTWTELPDMLCQGDSINLDVNSNEYTWNTTGTSEIINNTLYLNLEDEVSDSETINLEVCNETLSQEIWINHIPVPVLTSENFWCSDQNIIINSNIDDFSNTEWNISGVDNFTIDDSDLNNILLSINDFGFDTLTLDMEVEVDNNGCIGSGILELIVFEEPQDHDLDAGENQVLFDQTNISLNAEYSGTGSITWLNSIENETQFSFDTEILNPMISNVSPGDYEFYLIAENGVCPSIMDSVSIEVNSFIPNGFSPDNDGIDDFFVIPGIEHQDVKQLIVFNLSGSEVYRNMNYNNSWNGVNQNGLPLVEDTYYYILRLDQIEKTDFVIIKRN